jgi:CHAD domain-containing protein
MENGCLRHRLDASCGPEAGAKYAPNLNGLKMKGYAYLADACRFQPQRIGRFQEAVKLQPDQVEKPLKKLRKQLKELPSNPLPADVHSLRTQARRLEATVAAVAPGRNKASRRLLKLITPVRKAAGKVRDMDVLIGDVLTLPDDQGSKSLVRLVEHLARMRVKHARKLRHVVAQQRPEARKQLKQSSKMLKKAVKRDWGDRSGEAAPQILISELGRWPDVDAGNLHMFRIRIKELRYMLQLSDEADQTLIGILGEVKDAIGEWHDWVELLRIAKKVLSAQDDGGNLKQLEKIVNEQFESAVAAANQLRERYFKRAADTRGNKKVLQMAAGF